MTTYHQYQWDDDYQPYPGYEDMVGQYNTQDRCPECGRYTLYFNNLGEEWCFYENFH